MYENEVKKLRGKSAQPKEDLARSRLKKAYCEPEVKSWRVLLKAFQTIYTHLEKGMSADGVTISRFQVLLMLYFDGPLSASDISRRLLVSRGNMSMFLRRLTSDRLVEVSDASKSKTRPLYCLTKGGAKQFEALFPRHVKRIKELMPSLPNSMIRILSDISWN
ncbi:MAG: MarR family winged helix-turn-helix transcriptional regulator [Bdellovibrionales bacterium]